MKLDRDTAIGGLVFLTIGAIFLSCAGVSASHTRDFHATALQAQGTVVGYKTTQSDDGIGYYPTIEFTALRTAPGDSLEYRIDEGRKVTFTASVGRGSMTYGIGASVPVSYLPEAPEEARLDSFAQNWLLACVLGGFGLVFSGAGIVIMRGARR
jgi:hypothetical protein